jgi:RHS repeat-associated protein
MVNGLSSVVNYVYDDANRLTSVNSVTYTWDNNGNLLNDGVNAYTYDSTNRLKQLTQGANTYTYSYNGLGDRLSQNGVNYTLDLNAGLTQVLNDGTNTYLYGVGRIAQVNSSTEYFLGDALGSVRQLTNAQGNVTLAKSYAPYGEVMSSAGSGTSAFAYTGEQMDASGLTYLRARYYSGNMGRFLTRDTWDGNASQPMSYNRWLYVYSNPVMFVDPTGFVPCPWNPALNCTWDQVWAYYADPLLKLLGIEQKSYNLNIPGVGNINTTGTPTRMFLERTGPALATIGDTGLSLMPGGGSFYDSMNAALGYNQITGYRYTGGERLWLSAFAFLGCWGDLGDAKKLYDVIEFGSGMGLKNADILVKETRRGKVLLTEAPWVRIPEGTSRRAIKIGAEVKPSGYQDLASQGYRTLKSVAIAPDPRDAEFVAKTMSEVTVPGGEIYVVTREEFTARTMARIFSSYFGIEIVPIPTFRSSISYASDFLESDVFLINFKVPSIP